MSAPDYTCTIQTTASPDDAYDKVARVSEWWAKNFEGSARKLGDTFTVRFGKTFVDFKVVEAVPARRVVWSVTDCHLEWIADKTEWNGTNVAWDIASANGITNVTITHHGLVPGVECYNDCEQGWNGHVQNSLRQLLNGGEGMPE